MVVASVIKRVRGFLIVLVVSAPLTPQLDETKKEITLWPHKPNLLNNLSVIKAMRDI